MDSSDEESEDETPRHLISKMLPDMRTSSLPLNRRKGVERSSPLILRRTSSVASTPAQSPTKKTASPRRSREVATIDKKAQSSKVSAAESSDSAAEMVFRRGRRRIVPGKYLKQPFDMKSLSTGVAKQMETLKDDENLNLNEVNEKDTSDSNLRLRRFGRSVPPAGRKLRRPFDVKQLAANVKKRVAEDPIITDDEDSEVAEVASPEIENPVKRVFGRRRGQDEYKAVRHPFQHDDFAAAIEKRIQVKEFGYSFTDSSAISTANNSLAAAAGRSSLRESMSGSARTLGDTRHDRGDSLNNISQTKAAQQETGKSGDSFSAIRQSPRIASQSPTVSNLRRSPRKATQSPDVLKVDPANETTIVIPPAADETQGSPKRVRNSSISAKKVAVISESEDDLEESSKSKPQAPSAKNITKNDSEIRSNTSKNVSGPLAVSPRRSPRKASQSPDVAKVSDSDDNLIKKKNSVSTPASNDLSKNARKSSDSARRGIMNESDKSVEQSPKSKSLIPSGENNSARLSNISKTALNDVRRSPRKVETPDVTEFRDLSRHLIHEKITPGTPTADVARLRRKSTRNSSLSAKKVTVIVESESEFEEPVFGRSKLVTPTAGEARLRRKSSRNSSPSVSTKVRAINESDSEFEEPAKPKLSTPTSGQRRLLPKSTRNSSQSAKKVPVSSESGSDFEEPPAKPKLVTPTADETRSRPKSTRISSPSAKKVPAFNESDSDFEELAMPKLVSPTVFEPRSPPKRVSFVSGKKIPISSDSDDDSVKSPKSRLSNMSSSSQNVNLVVIHETTKDLAGSLRNDLRRSPRKDRNPDAATVDDERSESETPVPDEHSDRPSSARKSIRSGRKMLGISESDDDVGRESSGKSSKVTSPVFNRTMQRTLPQVSSQKVTDSSEYFAKELDLPKPVWAVPKVVIEKLRDSFIERSTKSTRQNSSVIESQSALSSQGINGGILEIIAYSSDADSSDHFSTDFIPGTGTLLQSYKSSQPPSPIPTPSITPSPVNLGAKLDDVNGSYASEPNPQRRQSRLRDESGSRRSSKPHQQQRSILDYIVDPEEAKGNHRNYQRTSTPYRSDNLKPTDINNRIPNMSPLDKTLTNENVDDQRESSVKNDGAEGGKSSTYDTVEKVLKTPDKLKKSRISAPKEAFDELEIVEETTPKGPLYRSQVKKRSSLEVSPRKSGSSTSERGSLGTKVQSRKRKSTDTDETPSAAKKPHVSEKRSGQLVQSKLTKSGSTKNSPKKSKPTKCKAKSVGPLVSRACVRSNAELIIGKRLPPEALSALHEESENFLKTTMKNLLGNRDGKKKVSDKVVLDYFISIGLFKDRDHFLEFVRNNAPLDVRAALIPCARAGNIVTPPMYSW